MEIPITGEKEAKNQLLYKKGASGSDTPEICRFATKRDTKKLGSWLRGGCGGGRGVLAAAVFRSQRQPTAEKKKERKQKQKKKKRKSDCVWGGGGLKLWWGKKAAEFKTET